MAVPLTAAAMVTAATMRNRPAPTDITITILTLARRTDITGQTGSITASSLGSVPGTVGAGAAVADTGATIGADVATVIAVDMDIAAATDTAADTVITVDMDAAGMDTMAATAVDIMVAGLTPVADTTAVAADTMAVAVDTMAVGGYHGGGGGGFHGGGGGGFHGGGGGGGFHGGGGGGHGGGDTDSRQVI